MTQWQQYCPESKMGRNTDVVLFDMCLLHADQNELFHQKWQATQRFEKPKGFNISWELWPNNCRTPYQNSMWSPLGSTRQTKYQGSKFDLVDSNISVYRSHQKHPVMTQHPQTSWTFASQIWGAPTVSPNLFRLMAFHMFPHPVLKRHLRWQECMQRRNVPFFAGGESNAAHWKLQNTSGLIGQSMIGSSCFLSETM